MYGAYERESNLKTVNGHDSAFEEKMTISESELISISGLARGSFLPSAGNFLFDGLISRVSSPHSLLIVISSLVKKYP